MAQKGTSFLKNEDGAIAPLYALSLTALIAIGGIAFDYSRMASMDSELQGAADQAALAAASQLDGLPGATARAEEAAGALVANQTRFANDGNADGRAVTIASVTFYSCDTVACRDDRTRANMTVVERDDAATTDDDAARFVEVTVNNRRSFYALTPIVNAISSGDMNAIALAGMGSAICRVPPVMMCNPFEETTTGADFPIEDHIGAGLALITGDADAPGNFGFLDTGFDPDDPGSENSTRNLTSALGHDVPPGNCAPTDLVDLKTGLRDVAFNAFNTRFDIDVNGAQTCPTGGVCSGAINSRKDLVRDDKCDLSNKGWSVSNNPYRPTTTTPLESGYPDVMGHPRDMCHAIDVNGTCDDGKVGDGVWDIDAYFQVNYGWDRNEWETNTGFSFDPLPTRYEVYLWEIENPQGPQTVGGKTAHSAPVCRSTPGANIPDRRRLSAAIINCKDLSLNGNESDVRVLKWVDLFLVEPSIDRERGSGRNKVQVTRSTDVYVEIIGATNVTGGGGGQVIRRDVPYLIE